MSTKSIRLSVFPAAFTSAALGASASTFASSAYAFLSVFALAYALATGNRSLWPKKIERLKEPALTFNGFWMALASCPTDLCYLVWYCLSRCVLFYRKHPNQQLKKEFRCQFHTLYHKKVVLLPSGLLVIDQWLTPRPRALAL